MLYRQYMCSNCETNQIDFGESVIELVLYSVKTEIAHFGGMFSSTSASVKHLAAVSAAVLPLFPFDNCLAGF